MPGDDSMDSTTYINKNARNLNQVPFGKICLQIIRTKMYECLRHTSSPYDPDLCAPMIFSNDHLLTDDLEIIGEAPAGYKV